MDEFTQLLNEIGLGRNISPSPYDTAWLTRLDDQAPDLSIPALEWLCAHQNDDGTWGASQPVYFSDRLVCTLAAMTALTRRGRRASDRRQIERGRDALERLAAGATRNLSMENTCGFELIAPTLVSEAESLGIIKHQGDHILGRLIRERNKKLASLPTGTVNRTLTVAFSAEMAGEDEKHLLDIPNLPEANGSIAYSPSATSYFTRYVHQYPPALEYLRSVTTDSSVPYTAPIDVFEIAWSFWYFLLSGHKAELSGLDQVAFLEKNWQPGRGAAPDSGLTLVDGDTTSMVANVLTQLGGSPDLATLLNYEMEDHFRCYWLESNPSISTNIHAVGALRQMGYADHPVVQKLIKFLRLNRTPQGYWFDKWHASSYYATAHIVLNCEGVAPDLVDNAGKWILSSQQPSGGWGMYPDMQTAEETAYALLALTTWQRSGGPVPKSVLQRGARWLQEHKEPPYSLLWIGKVLYCPEVIVRATIWSALEMVRQQISDI
jgi:halimadienyl-diphosphate synthase